MGKSPSGAMMMAIQLEGEGSALELESPLHEYLSTRRNTARHLSIAAINSSKQLVCSGKARSLLDLQTSWSSAFPNYKVKAFMPLKYINYAFHSPFMADAAKDIKLVARDIQFNNDNASMVISNVTANPLDVPSHDDSLGEYLSQQILQPVRWYQSVRYLADNGFRDFVIMTKVGILRKLIENDRSLSGRIRFIEI